MGFFTFHTAPCWGLPSGFIVVRQALCIWALIQNWRLRIHRAGRATRLPCPQSALVVLEFAVIVRA